jgi:hypothetical protein
MKLIGPGMARVGSSFKSYLGKAPHQSGMEWVKFDLGFGKMAPKGLGGLIGPTGLALAAYGGYKEGGALGAGKEIGKSLLTSYAFGAITKGLRLGSVGADAAGFAIGVVIGTLGYQAGFAMTHTGGISNPYNPLAPLVRPAVANYMRAHRDLEMGGPVFDQFGTLATMRQRSISAIQNSKLNGRSVLSNEATYQYRPYFR